MSDKQTRPNEAARSSSLPRRNQEHMADSHTRTRREAQDSQLNRKTDFSAVSLWSNVRAHFYFPLVTPLFHLLPLLSSSPSGCDANRPFFCDALAPPSTYLHARTSARHNPTAGREAVSQNRQENSGKPGYNLALMEPKRFPPGRRAPVLLGKAQRPAEKITSGKMFMQHARLPRFLPGK